VDVVTVKELLGHSNIGTTTGCAHSSDDGKRRRFSEQATVTK
jgi:site-specific recombinase XerD